MYRAHSGHLGDAQAPRGLAPGASFTERNKMAALSNTYVGRVITQWVADARARRVPNFVTRLTGRHTKREIVSEYGEGVVFKIGKDGKGKVVRKGKKTK